MVMFVPCRKLQKVFNTLYFCNFAKICLLYGKLKLCLRNCFILFCSEVLCSQGVGPQQEENALSIWCDLCHRFVG